MMICSMWCLNGQWNHERFADSGLGVGEVGVTARSTTSLAVDHIVIGNVLPETAAEALYDLRGLRQWSLTAAPAM